MHAYFRQKKTSTVAIPPKTAVKRDVPPLLAPITVPAAADKESNPVVESPKTPKRTSSSSSIQAPKTPNTGHRKNLYAEIPLRAATPRTAKDKAIANLNAFLSLTDADGDERTGTKSTSTVNMPATLRCRLFIPSDAVGPNPVRTLSIIESKAESTPAEPLQVLASPKRRRSDRSPVNTPRSPTTDALSTLSSPKKQKGQHLTLSQRKGSLNVPAGDTLPKTPARKLVFRSDSNEVAPVDAKSAFHSVHPTITCAVCFFAGPIYGQSTIRCRTCGILVHPSCYGLSEVQGEDWQCQPCNQGANSSECSCELCPFKGGALKRTQSRRREWVHVACAIWSNTVSIVNVADMTIGPIPEDIRAEKEANENTHQKECSLCNHNGGILITCQEADCNTRMHVLCALSSRKQLQFQVEVGKKKGERAAKAIMNTIARCEAHSDLKFDVTKRWIDTTQKSKNTNESKQKGRKAAAVVDYAEKPEEKKLAIPDDKAELISRVLEHLLSSMPENLAEFQKAIKSHVPIVSSDWPNVLVVLSKAFSFTALNRIYEQVSALGVDAADSQRWIRKSKCNNQKCAKSSALATICTHCGNIDVRPVKDLSAKSKDTLLHKRERSVLRSLKYVKSMVKNGGDREFEFHAGDIIFLVRNVIFHGTDAIKDSADQLVRGMIQRYDKAPCSKLDRYAEIEQLLAWVECHHAKLEMGILPDPAKTQNQASTVLSQLSLEDVVRYDPAAWERKIPFTQAGYCKNCGKFESMTLKVCPSKGCKTTLQTVQDYETLCEALVWCSVFNELGVPVAAADGTCKVEDILHLIKSLRPYKSLEVLGKDSFLLQCYFLTHLFFILTGWGSIELKDRLPFIEEYVFFAANVATIAKLNDPELMGEVVHALRILGAGDGDLAILEGTKFLLSVEKKGMFVDEYDTYYKRYHAAYCGIIGLSPWHFDETRVFPASWLQYFIDEKK